MRSVGQVAVGKPAAIGVCGGLTMPVLIANEPVPDSCAACGTDLNGWACMFDGQGFCSACDNELHAEVYAANVRAYESAQHAAQPD